MYTLNEQTFIDMYTEIYLVMYFNQDTKRSSATVKVQKIPLEVFSQLSATLTSVQLMGCWIGPVPVLWLLDVFLIAFIVVWSSILFRASLVASSSSFKFAYGAYSSALMKSGTMFQSKSWIALAECDDALSCMNTKSLAG